MLMSLAATRFRRSITWCICGSPVSTLSKLTRCVCSFFPVSGAGAETAGPAAVACASARPMLTRLVGTPYIFTPMGVLSSIGASSARRDSSMNFEYGTPKSDVTVCMRSALRL